MAELAARAGQTAGAVGGVAGGGAACAASTGRAGRGGRADGPSEEWMATVTPETNMIHNASSSAASVPLRLEPMLPKTPGAISESSK